MEHEEYGRSFAVTVTRADGHWVVRSFDDDFSALATSVQAVRQLRSEGPAFALLCVDDDYFVIVRPTPNGVQALVSDATMAVDDDFAAEILSELDAEIPDLDPDELDDVDGWPDGDFDLLADVGLSEEILGVIADDDDLWPSEQLVRIAEELGFADELIDVAGVDD
ncbi:MAG: tRNA adenosine deaminase-associated protein [Corynebacterium sp.]|uniref:tRNA adenosine deaminase-associated protein n=1 Tax=Corynebacterium sp. TaxID=1720 RepID=UPI0026E0984C|nr:tRNA adenosine deaminase-associated protein [Corynebacterium sp.]MDO5668435.1 tRNA adenosine deaminase-associated protein [Corynebacterium sp.]